MPRHNLEYPRGARNTVNRKGKDRGNYELKTINSIIHDAMVVHVSFSPGPDDPFPVILPMIGTMGSFDAPSATLDEPLDCYLHGYVSSRLMKLSQEASLAAETGSSSTHGLPVCIAASKVDGLVLSLTPNSHSYNYRSAVLFGHAEVVTNEAERLWAMQRITNKVVPERWEHTRVPPNAAEMQSTKILRVRIDSGSAKVRDGAPGDERADLQDADLTASVWTGFVPLLEQLGAPVASTYNEVREVPEHVTRYVEAYNAKNRDYSEKVIRQVEGTQDLPGES